ncbi:anti-sigma factor RsbA family regulatory protein [Nonomuraea sp. NPDC059194]|uniref:anti-sigma factor RsbA family regulatory protein n=1 Tax=Nonomuraea sp. NPDC059194 TaxID=3346764 RepID=UPI0036C86B33
MAFAHPAFFYRDDADYLSGTVPFIRAGLAAGDPVAVAVPGPNLEVIRDELDEAAERVRMLDMTVVGRNPGRIIPGVLREFADNFPDRHVRIIGEPIWAGRTGTEYPACVQHEALINLAFEGRRVTIMCPYDVKRLEPEILDDAELTHPVVQDITGERESAAYAPLRVIDGYNVPLYEPPASVALHFDSTNFGQVRHLANEWATAAGLTGTRLDDVQLTVSELGANSLDHGGGSGVLRIWHEESRLVCEVSDGGHITDPLAGRSPVDPRTPGSRGLLIVNLLSDLVRVHTREGSTVVRAYFDR